MSKHARPQAGPPAGPRHMRGVRRDARHATRTAGEGRRRTRVTVASAVVVAVATGATGLALILAGHGAGGLAAPSGGDRLQPAAGSHAPTLPAADGQVGLSAQSLLSVLRP